MSTHVKICGITDHGGAEAAVAAGADSLGFVFAPSPREIQPSVAAQISTAIPGATTRVAVFVSAKLSAVAEVLADFPADVVQADRGTKVPDGVALLPVFRESPGVIDEIRFFASGRTDVRFVYEGPTSGMGKRVDWELAATAAALGQMTLAGGLGPHNVEEAIHTVGPFGVDVSSGVESAPGIKDPSRIRAFLCAVREAERGWAAR